MLPKRLFIRILAIFALVVATMTTGLAEENPSDEIKPVLNEDPVATDAAPYAEYYGLSLDEAIQRLELQGPVGNLQEQLMTTKSEVFGGMWIEHEPDFRVVVLLTVGDEEVVAPFVEGGPLDGQIEVRSAEETYESLQSIQRNTIDALREAGDIVFESTINQQQNRVELYVTDREAVDNARQEGSVNLHERVDIIVVSQLGDDDADIFAGLSLTPCTSGYTVKNGQNVYGITTAGHCGQPVYYGPTGLPFIYEAWGGPYDVQWHTTPGYTDRPWAKEPSGYRVITAKKTWSQQSEGEWVCKYGKTTGHTCGHIVEKDYQPTPNTPQVFSPVFIRVHHPSGANLSSDGDSGGPWYYGGTAYGILKGGAAGGNDASYMAIDYAEYGLGVTVLTQ